MSPTAIIMQIVILTCGAHPNRQTKSRLMTANVATIQKAIIANQS
jgi:hypothetical protein